MRKAVLLFAGVALLALYLSSLGCGDMVTSFSPMSNDEIIKQVAKCESVGMRAELLRRSDDGRAYDVICIPRKDQ